MASSEALPTNGHVRHPDGADNAQLCDVEHEDTTGTKPVEPKQVRSAETEGEPLALDDHPASQSPLDKHKQPTSPAKRPPPVHTATKGVSGPPTPQVKKVLIFPPAPPFVTLFLTCTSRIADIKFGQVWHWRHQGCSTSNRALHFCQAFYHTSSPQTCTHFGEEIHLCTVLESDHATQTVNHQSFRSSPDT